MKTVSSKPISWFGDFIGVGYRYHDIYMNVIPLFEDKMPAFRLWKKTIDWWPDDEIKLRFVEQGGSYWRFCRRPFSAAGAGARTSASGRTMVETMPPRRDSSVASPPSS